MNKILATVRLIVGIVFLLAVISMFIYLGVYRLSHPSLTETQLFFNCGGRHYLQFQ
jgi:fumarate reductase subunit D